MNQTILLTVDYHDENCVVRRLVTETGQEDVLKVSTAKKELLQIVAQARVLAGRSGRVVWLQESTNGWARVKALLEKRVEFVLANVLQMPLPPKGQDELDTLLE